MSKAAASKEDAAARAAQKAAQRPRVLVLRPNKNGTGFKRRMEDQS